MDPLAALPFFVSLITTFDKSFLLLPSSLVFPSSSSPSISSSPSATFPPSNYMSSPLSSPCPTPEPTLQPSIIRDSPQPSTTSVTLPLKLLNTAHVAFCVTSHMNIADEVTAVQFILMQQSVVMIDRDDIVFWCAASRPRSSGYDALFKKVSTFFKLTLRKEDNCNQV